jgi:hypothetical protein
VVAETPEAVGLGVVVLLYGVVLGVTLARS